MRRARARRGLANGRPAWVGRYVTEDKLRELAQAVITASDRGQTLFGQKRDMELALALLRKLLQPHIRAWQQ